jgi:hypothetical protein
MRIKRYTMNMYTFTNEYLLMMHNGFLDIKAADLFTPGNIDRGTRGHKYKLLQNHCRVDVRKYYFVERIVRQWNNL